MFYYFIKQSKIVITVLVSTCKAFFNLKKKKTYKTIK